MSAPIGPDNGTSRLTTWHCQHRLDHPLAQRLNGVDFEKYLAVNKIILP
jgi:hypothetical protein